MSGNSDTVGVEDDRRDDGNDVRDRLEQLVDRARAGFDEGVVGVLSWLLNTETRTRVYVYLSQSGWSTSDDVAEGVGLHPASVRNTLEELVEQNAVDRREHDGGEYEYDAVPPSDLPGVAVDGVRGTLESAVQDEEGEESVRLEVDSGSAVTAEAGEAEVDAETDLEGEVELDEEEASVEGKAGGELDVETSDGDAEIEASVDADVGTDGVDVNANVETPDGDDAEESPDSPDDERADDDAEAS